MSLWFPLHVNDETIAVVTIRRLEALDLKFIDYYEYEWQVIPYGAESKISAAAGKVEHRYKSGALALISEVMDAYRRAGVVS